jgi:hypothetical protein
MLRGEGGGLGGGRFFHHLPVPAEVRERNPICGLRCLEWLGDVCERVS